MGHVRATAQATGQGGRDTVDHRRGGTLRTASAGSGDAGEGGCLDDQESQGLTGPLAWRFAIRQVISGNAMTLEGINPKDLPTPETYTHVIAATGRRLVFVAGQEPEDSQGNVAGSVTWQPRRVRCSPISVVLLRRPARGPIR